MISLETLQSAISNVSVWRQGDVCAPHKPLLLLYVLSQYKAGHPRLFNYGLEIHEPLTRLLKEFGPKRRTDYPNIVAAAMNPEHVAECDHRILRSEFLD